MNQNFLDHIMTAEEYATLQPEVPYIFALENQGKSLLYFGTHHTYDNSDPTFAQIEKKFDEFQPDLVLVEGMSSEHNQSTKKEFTDLAQQGKGSSREDIIARWGEPRFTAWMASARSIDWESPEPFDRDTYQYFLGEGFSREEILAWFALLYLPQYERSNRPETFEQYLVQPLSYFEHETGWASFDYSYRHAMKQAARIIGHPIDPTTDADPQRYTDPIPWDEVKDTYGVLNRIGAEFSRYRDQFMVNEIANYLKKYDRIMIVFGATHAVMQEPALRALFAEKSYDA